MESLASSWKLLSYSPQVADNSSIPAGAVILLDHAVGTRTNSELWARRFAKIVPALGRAGLDSARHALGLLSVEQLRVRGPGDVVFIDSFSGAPAKDLPKLMLRADTLLRKFVNPVDQYLLAGLMVGVLHPLRDGNGRWMRLLWANALWRFGCSAERTGTVLQAFRDQMLAVSTGLSLAMATGDSSRLRQWWHERLGDGFTGQRPATDSS